MREYLPWILFVIGTAAWLKFASWYVDPQKPGVKKELWFPKLQKRKPVRAVDSLIEFKLKRPRPDWKVIKGGKE